LSIEHKEIVKPKISYKIYNYYSFFNKKIKFDEFNNNFWSHKFNSSDPYSGWGTKYFTPVYSLSGSNVNIVPQNTIGYLLDSLSNNCNKQPGYCDNYTKVFNKHVIAGEIYRASVYCYVSDSFDGISARIIAGSSAVTNKVIGHQNSILYDLSNISSWQKLSIELKCINDGELPIYISFNRINPEPYKGINGFVIFAYPELKKISSDTSYFSTKQSRKIKSKNSYNTSVKNDLFKNEKISYAGLNLLLPLIETASMLNVNDPFFDRLKNTFSIDTTYYAYKENLNSNFGKIDIAEDRLSRWKFSLEIFEKEYNTAEKIFGGGFDFLNWYGKVFKNDEDEIDYPHNPFLHILLYSGIIGVILYIFFLYSVCFLYWKYRKEYPVMFFSFLITYFFTFFSGGNPFSPPMTGFFILLPFLIHSIHKKDSTPKVTATR
jgi:hypothetical protein